MLWFWLIYVAFILLFAAGSGTTVFGQKPSNDRCIDSVLLVEGEMTNGDNSNANFDYNNQGVCGSRSDRRAVWYEINGIGKEVTVNICTNNDKITDYGIFRACNTQNCLGAPAQQLEAANCGVNDQESNPYSFLAIDEESYYVHVRSDVVFEGEGSNFTIWYTEPKNDASTEIPVTDNGSDNNGSPSSSLIYTVGYTSIVSIVIIFFGLSFTL